MKADAIRRKLRDMDVPLERAVWAAEKYGDDTVSPGPKALAQRMLNRELRRKTAEMERRKFRVWCLGNGLPLPTFEYYFAQPRQYRFDVCWEPEKIAIEIQGGIWRKGGGAHTGKGHLRDMEKLNLAQRLQWRVLQRTPQNLFTDDTLSLLRPLLTQETP